jgi:NADH-quinone oxidoreductase subunit L
MNGDFGLIWVVLLLPVLGFLIQAFLGKRLARTAGKRVVGALAVIPILASFAVAVMLTLKLSSLAPDARSAVVTGFPWIDTAGFKIPFEFVVDPLSMTMVLIITGIGGLIHLYATGYMSEERDYARFFTYLNLFIAAMLLLVLGNNLLLLFMGWEGVGLCSYLLIGFWYKDLANARAANKAFVVNRIGDWGLGLGLFLIFALLVHDYGMVDGARFLSYDVMLPKLGRSLSLHPDMATLLAILLFIGAAGKSAQFPLYMWLPDAMAGPTPVSALIHAATMVTSGVVLLNRMHVVFENSPVASAIIAVIGAFTALFAAVIAFGQTDIKKVLAFSTVSQLGFMFIACGSGAYWAGMFHVTTHAFFKALLFLGAGAVIHAMAHNQDMRNYGNLRKYLPITFFTMVIGWLAISAVAIPIGEHIFGFAGAYSKESILASAIAYDHASIDGYNLGQAAGYVGLFVALLTSIYMTRLTFLTFMGKEERWRAIPAHAGGEHHDEGHQEVQAVHEETSLDYEPNVHIDAPKVAAFEAHPQEQSLAASHDLTLPADPHGFYYESEPLAHDVEHHHELDGSHTPREVPVSMWLPLVVLAVLSVGGGYVLANDDAFKNWLYPKGLEVLSNLPPAHVANLPIMSAVAAILGIVLGAAFYAKGLPKDQGWDLSKWAGWRRSAHDQFGVDSALTVNSVEGGGDLARGIWRFVDVGLFDGIVNGSGALAAWTGRILRTLQSGYVRLYALVMLLGGVGLLGYLLLALRQLGGAR